jgi:citrate/tricarballylate utilization protein
MHSDKMISINLVQELQRNKTIPIGLIEEGQRITSICNACRYCEGFCAVFPALERRLSFTEGDLSYLANLCHNCGSCYPACQYSPPHEFALNLPKTLAEIRVASYEKYAWPNSVARLYKRNGVAVGVIAALSIALFLMAVMLMVNPDTLFTAHSVSEGSFYRIIPHRVMAALFGGVSLFVVLAFVVGFVRFWRDTGEKVSSFFNAGALRTAMHDAMSLKNLGGGGDGCTYPSDQPSQVRRRFHHMTFYGFMSCFAATSVATVYHYVFGWPAPYGFFSLPVILGTLGGIGLIGGPLGLLWLKRTRMPELQDQKQKGMDAGFLVMLILTSATGLGLLAFRESAGMGMLLAIHLGFVMGFFLTMPYGKFVHAIYRSAALVLNAVESDRPSQTNFAD